MPSFIFTSYNNNIIGYTNDRFITRFICQKDDINY